MGDGVDRRSTKLIIGASTEDTAAGATGCAYVYEDDDEDHSWDFLKQLTAPEGADWDYFGHSVDVSGNSLIAGSYGDDDHGSSSGSAYLYVSIYAGRTVQSWDLDAVGNWTTTTVNGTLQHREHNAANEIQSLDGDESNVAYDVAGNMTTIPQLALPGYVAGRFTARYDAWNRLRFVCRDDGSEEGEGQWDAGDTTVAEYRYDGLGRRITKLVLDPSDGKWDRTDYFYNDRWQVLEERVAPNLTGAQKETTLGSPHVQYVWDIRYLDSPICRLRDANDDWDADGDGEKDPGSDGLEETLYYLTDANHNVTALVEPNGNVVERYLYDAYGRVHVLNGAADPDGAVLAEWTLDPDNVSDVSNEILYAGYRHDPETLLYHVRHRYLHATLGRWLTSDPKGYVDGMSLYEYCRSGPVGARDPLGLTGAYHPTHTQRDPRQLRDALGPNHPIFPRRGVETAQAYYQQVGDWLDSLSSQERFEFAFGGGALAQAFRLVMTDLTGRNAAEAEASYRELLQAFDLPVINAGPTSRTSPSLMKELLKARLAEYDKLQQKYLEGQTEVLKFYAAAECTVCLTGMLAPAIAALPVGEAAGATWAAIKGAASSASTAVANIAVRTYIRIAGPVITGAGFLQKQGRRLMAWGADKWYSLNARVATFMSRAPSSAPKFKTWNQFQAGMKGQFASRAEAGRAWAAYKEANGIVTGSVPSQAVRGQYLRSLVDDYRTPSWMKQWLRKGKVPPGYEVDHIKPVSIGGPDTPANMRLQLRSLHDQHHAPGFYRPWE